MAEMESAVLEEYSVSYVNEENKVYTTPENSGQGSVDYSTMYTTFEALEDGTFSFSKNGTGEDIQYSKDNGTTWTPLASGEKVSIVAGEKVMWKSTITPVSQIGIGTFSSTNKFNVCGNIMSLLYGDSFKGITTFENLPYIFYGLFKHTDLIDASRLILPLETLTNSCYEEMFAYCKSLTTTPELPATTLAERCYYNMFMDCYELTTTPELPATTLAYECYCGMFAYCINLTTAPELPATTLAENCYWGMFYSCESLTTSPKLPATTLANSCYSNMFNCCYELTTAPELPATTLAENCYQGMFMECSELTTAPVLPATTLAEGCYDGMFTNCTSLTTAPKLLSAILVGYCYREMFKYCINLNHITMLATDISANSCLSNWVNGVSSTGTFVKYPDMTSLPTGISGIPEGWTVEDAVL